MTKGVARLFAVMVMALAAALIVPSGGSAWAQQPSATDIVDALKPKPVTRGLTRSITGAGATSTADRAFIEDLKNRQTRSISVEERGKMADVARSKPSIDLEVTFDYDSAEIGAKAMPTLVTLGTALRNPELQGQSFLVGGHTDASGGDTYNQALSERRAEAVKRFLVEKFSLRPDSLIGIGFGKEQPKNKTDPLAAENRRVQIVNLSAQ